MIQVYMKKMVHIKSSIFNSSISCSNPLLQNFRQVNQIKHSF